LHAILLQVEGMGARLWRPVIHHNQHPEKSHIAI